MSPVLVPEIPHPETKIVEAPPAPAPFGVPPPIPTLYSTPQAYIFYFTIHVSRAVQYASRKPFPCLCLPLFEISRTCMRSVGKYYSVRFRDGVLGDSERAFKSVIYSKSFI